MRFVTHPSVLAIGLLCIHAAAGQQSNNQAAASRLGLRTTQSADAGQIGPAAGALAIWKAAPGWLTRGLVLPLGAAKGALQIGDLPTQNDVLMRWPDGSIGHVVLTAKIPAEGRFAIHPGTEAAGSFAPNLIACSVEFVTPAGTFVAKMPTTLPAVPDYWFQGPLMQNQRFQVAPVDGSGNAHSLLRVWFDAHCYQDGTGTIDVIVNNFLDVKQAEAVTYDVTVQVDGKTVFSQAGVTHNWRCRWAGTWPARSFTESTAVADFEPFVRAHAMPRFLHTVPSDYPAPTGDKFSILREGYLWPFMPEHGGGGRPEDAPQTYWVARWLAHPESKVLEKATIRSGDLAGSWPVHICHADGSDITIDKYPLWRMDRAGRPPGQGPQAAPPWRGSIPRLVPDNAHQPPLLALLPYLVTGRRYYCEELAYWANFCLLQTSPDAGGGGKRQGSLGLLWGQEVRGFGWALRNIADAGRWLPDRSSWKRYFIDKTRNNLAWLDQAASQPTQYGCHFQRYLASYPPPDKDRNWPYVMLNLWEYSMLAYAIDHANQLGFSGGLSYRDQLARFQLSLFSPPFDRSQSCPYELKVGKYTDAKGRKKEMFRTLQEAWDATYGTGAPATRIIGHYGVNARVLLQYAVERKMEGAETALQYIDDLIQRQRGEYGMPDLLYRSGWAIVP
ncbi:MAG TPA: hypothetical protein VK395_17490 [Gemmataceae bacterium]|nr:hypothetical protein [Gemmataceae bacterium]